MPFNSSAHSRNAERVTSLHSFNSSIPSQNDSGRPLSERERDILLRWCGSDSDPLILLVREIFNATISGLNSPAAGRHVSERQLTLWNPENRTKRPRRAKNVHSTNLPLRAAARTQVASHAEAVETPSPANY